jgi:hypothetical protein
VLGAERRPERHDQRHRHPAQFDPGELHSGTPST